MQILGLSNCRFPLQIENVFDHISPAHKTPKLPPNLEKPKTGDGGERARDPFSPWAPAAARGR